MNKGTARARIEKQPIKAAPSKPHRSKPTLKSRKAGLATRLKLQAS